MLSDRAHYYLSMLKRMTPVPTEEVERVLERQGDPCCPAWLDFHERYAGYVVRLGFEVAVLGIVHNNSCWIRPGAAVVERSYHPQAEWLVTCADVHPSYEYRLGDTGFFWRPAAANFQVVIERYAARDDFFGRPGAKQGFRAQIEQIPPDAREVLAGSDEHYRLWMGERFYALQETATGKLIDIGTREEGASR